MSKELIYNEEAWNKLDTGAKAVYDAVKVTLGPRGHNVIIEKAYGSPLITKDGVTVAKEIVLEDPFENMGAQLIKEIASKTNDVCGDGPQDLNSKILTPTGWIRMGDIRIGDTICGTNNTTQTVLGVFPKG